MIKVLLRFLSMLLLLLAMCNTYGQDAQYVFNQISSDRGLPGTNVKCLYQDHNGLMWFAIEAIGLCRFNGRNFEVYSHNPNNEKSLSNNFVNAIVEDCDNNLWIATEKGLNKLIKHQKQFKKYNVDSTNRFGHTDNLILSLFVDKHKSLWVGTGNGLYKYNKESDKFYQVKFKEDLGLLGINCIMEHSSGDFFLGTNNGLVQFNPVTGEVSHYKYQNDTVKGPMNNMVTCILEDFNGIIWLGTYRGVNKFDYQRKKFEIYNFKPEDAGIYEIEGFFTAYRYDKKHLWFASFTNGIAIINTETGKYQKLKKEDNTEGTLKSNDIRGILRDNSGLLWVAAKFQGILIYDSRKDMFNKLPEKYRVFQPLKNLDIRSVYFDSTKNLFWIGTMDFGLFKVDMNKNTVKHYIHSFSDDNSIGSNRIHRTYRDLEGNLWIGHWAGLDLFDEQNKRFIHYGNDLVDCIIEDLNHTIWIGANNGLYIVNKSQRKLERFKGNKDPFFTEEIISIMYVYRDPKGLLWFATRNNGFFRYNPINNTLKHYTTKSTNQKLKTNAIRPITGDDQGNLWIGTKGEGICIFNPEKETFRYLNSSDGLASDFVLCIQKDLNGNFWIGGHNGISNYDIKQKTFKCYTTTHGLQGNIFETGTNEMLKDGYLFFAGNAGFNFFHPDSIDIQKKMIIDSLIITSVKIFDHEILSDIHTNAELDLSYKQNYLTLEFVLSDYVEPLKHQFRYRMKGISDKWFELGNKNFVTFSNLNPGEYQFEAIGTNEFGMSCPNPLILKINIQPPFYKMWWFKGGTTLIILLIILFTAYYKIEQNKKMRQTLEKEILGRTEELREANAELTAQNHLIESQKAEIKKNQNLLEEKVKERTKDLEIAKKKAEESDKLKSAFLANMSHEIRTPLNAIIGFSSIIIDSVENNPEFASYSKIINNSSESLLQIINDILDISKIEAGQLEIIKSTISLHNLLENVYNTFNGQILDKYKDDIKFIVNISQQINSELTIETDLVRLNQVIFNLMNNAIKFTKKGFIEFGYTRETGMFKFYVKDTGIGIKTANLSMVFNRFVKLEVKNALYRGNGLGLALSKSIINLLGGKIWAESTENQGSTFYFTIPDHT